MNNCSKQHPLLCLIYANTVLEQHRWPWPVAWCIIHRKLQHLQPQAQTWPSTDFQDQAHWVLKKQNLKMTKTGYQWCLLSHYVQGGLHKWEVLHKYFSDVFPHRRALGSHHHFTWVSFWVQVSLSLLPYMCMYNSLK